MLNKPRVIRSGGYADHVPEHEWVGGVGNAQTAAQRDWEVHQDDHWLPTVAAGEEPVAVNWAGGVTSVRSTPTGIVEGPTMSGALWDALQDEQQKRGGPAGWGDISDRGGLLGAAYARPDEFAAFGDRPIASPETYVPPPPPPPQDPRMAGRMRARGGLIRGLGVMSDERLKRSVQRVDSDETAAIYAELGELRQQVAARERHLARPRGLVDRVADGRRRLRASVAELDRYLDRTRDLGT